MTENQPEPPAHERRGRGVRSQLLVAGLCLLLGFAIVTQVRQTQGDELAGMRQDDLVRLMAEITQRNETLVQEADELREDRSALLSGADASRSAEDYLEVQQILAGTVPVEGPGVVVQVANTADVSAQDMVHMLEELRNAGAEAVELSTVRIVASSYFSETDDGLVADGIEIGAEHEWRIIGDADKIAVALDIPNGAIDTLTSRGATVEVTKRPLVQVTAIRTVEEPQYATPSSDD
ncbi:DUF881 domain-containing protein [Pseudactinotalea suaedae]|uniref:DUF881 domain-containing protein n=1 Tax=Pseudactinotalea suaedae TaxID=1524924 RepID=UPI0012E10F6F|nr:DUF881 domain-containing protein [Pseudactinotalea suaedae]